MNKCNLVVAKENGLQGNRPKIFYGLVLLIELADVFYEKGCSLRLLSEKYGFLLPNLSSIVSKLANVGVIARNPNDEDWIYLIEEPRDMWMLKMMPVLKTTLKES